MSTLADLSSKLTESITLISLATKDKVFVWKTSQNALSLHCQQILDILSFIVFLFAEKIIVKTELNSIQPQLQVGLNENYPKK